MIIDELIYKYKSFTKEDIQKEIDRLNSLRLSDLQSTCLQEAKATIMFHDTHKSNEDLDIATRIMHENIREVLTNSFKYTLDDENAGIEFREEKINTLLMLLLEY